MHRTTHGVHDMLQLIEASEYYHDASKRGWVLVINCVAKLLPCKDTK